MVANHIMHNDLFVVELTFFVRIVDCICMATLISCKILSFSNLQAFKLFVVKPVVLNLWKTSIFGPLLQYFTIPTSQGFAQHNSFIVL